MECYHGIVSMDHSVKGHLTVDGLDIDFDDGRGYTEKDWGRSFPSAYLWMQSNHFSQPGISVKASVANITWIKNSFVGFIAGVWLHGLLIRFTTYNGSRLSKLLIDAGEVDLVMENSRYYLSVIISRENTASLASPVQGLMDGRIEESMTSVMEVLLSDKIAGQIVFMDSGRNAGLEVAGEISEIVK